MLRLMLLGLAVLGVEAGFNPCNAPTDSKRFMACWTRLIDFCPVHEDWEVRVERMLDTVIGQHVAVSVLSDGVFTTDWVEGRQQEATTLFFLGGTNTGKTSTVEGIAQALYSKTADDGVPRGLLKIPMGDPEYVVDAENTAAKVGYKLADAVDAHVRRCQRPIVLFDDIMGHADVMEVFKSRLDGRINEWRRGIFFFAANDNDNWHESAILLHFKQKVAQLEREDFTHHNINSKLQEEIGDATGISSAMQARIAHTIVPFLPLEREHLWRFAVARIREYFDRKGHSLHMNAEDVKDLADHPSIVWGVLHTKTVFERLRDCAELKGSPGYEECLSLCDGEEEAHGERREGICEAKFSKFGMNSMRLRVLPTLFIRIASVLKKYHADDDCQENVAVRDLKATPETFTMMVRAAAVDDVWECSLVKRMCKLVPHTMGGGGDTSGSGEGW